MIPITGRKLGLRKAQTCPKLVKWQEKLKLGLLGPHLKGNTPSNSSSAADMRFDPYLILHVRSEFFIWDMCKLGPISD